MPHNGAAPTSVTVRRWQLTASLRALREDAGLTIEQAVAALSAGSGRWSRAKLSRIENRDQGVRPDEVQQLLDLYQADQQTRAAITELAKAAAERGWWLALRRDLPDDFHPMLSLESALVGIRQFETMLVPGLLQTPDYARALIAGVHQGEPTERTERKVIARMARQQVLTRSDPMRFHVILEQAILERPVGTATVMRRQLQRLLEISESPHVTVQVIEKSVGPHAGWEGPFSILSLPEPIPDTCYIEGPGGAVYLDNSDQVARCARRFTALAGLALPAASSRALIEAAVKQFQ